MTSQNKQQDSNLQGGQSDDSRNDSHLPECPVPEMDGLWGLPLHPEDAEINCICDRLRACEQRVRTEDDDYAYVAAQAEADGRRRGWNEALDTARERIMRLPYEIDDEILIDRDEVLSWIDGLRDQPADQTGYNLPDAQ